MNKMERKFTVPCPIGKAFYYVLDFANLMEWCKPVEESYRLDLGPIKIGSNFKWVARFAGLSYTMTARIYGYKPLHFFALQIKHKKSMLRLKVNFQEQAGGSALSFRLDGPEDFFVGKLTFPCWGRHVFAQATQRLECLLAHQPEVFLPGETSNQLLAMMVSFTRLGWNRHRQKFLPTFKPKKPPSILLTGATSGLGLAASYRLASQACPLILVSRDEDKLEKLKADLLKRGYAGSLQTFVCDLTDLKQVASLGLKLQQLAQPLDVLINNAGGIYHHRKELFGVERSTILNLISPWLLSHIAYVLMQEKGGTIINMSSGGLYTQRLSVKELCSPSWPYSGARAYAQAKRAMLIFSEILAKKWQDSPVKIHCLHPGWAKTPGVRKGLPIFYTVTKKILRSPLQGADSMVWLALTGSQLPSGKFWFDRQIASTHITKKTLETLQEREELMTFLNRFL